MGSESHVHNTEYREEEGLCVIRYTRNPMLLENNYIIREQKAPHRTVIIDIDNELIVIENILKKYIPTSKYWWFTASTRYPLTVEEKIAYSETHKIVNTPYYPFIGLPIVLEILKNMAVVNSDAYELYFGNPVLDKKEAIVYANRDRVNTQHVNIVLDYIEDNSSVNLRNSELLNDVSFIVKIVEELFTNKIASLAAAFTTHIIDFNVTGKYVVMYSYGEAGLIRLDEATEVIRERVS